MKRYFILFLLFVVCFACSEKKNNFEDKTLRTIADLQDRRATDSLLIFLSSDNPKYRQAAALAFASVQSPSAITALAKLNEPDAAFALGQMYDHQAVAALVLKLSDKSETVQVEALKALGKVITKEDLAVFADSMDAEGLSWAYYYAGLRGVFDSTSVNRTASILDDPTMGSVAHLGAAHFFSRSQFKPTRVVTAVLCSTEDIETDVKMAMVNALAKLKPEQAIEAIARATTDGDYRVRVNSARALRTQPWDVAKPLFEKLLDDPNPHVNVAAAEVLLNFPVDTSSLHTWATTAENWRAQATLYSKLKGIDKEVRSLYAGSNNDYQKAALLNALSDPEFVFGEYKNNEAKIIKSTAAARLADISSDINIFKQIIADGDQGSIIPVCDALRDSTRFPRKLITDLTFLEEAKTKLSLPHDYETYVPLERTLNYFKGLPPPAPLKNEYNHTIDWTVAATIAKDQRVLVETSKGKIIMQLFIDEAPGSVVNFVNLVKSGYFNGRFFHRVVPNFVIQTGCSRGDGYGSEDYSIRSEFTQRKYKTGSVGMASAGKDTEGTQWFITHSPTPHLDGKYTIFAEVVSGMDVVHAIEVGDQIIKASLID